MQGVVSFPGIERFVNASYTLSHGITPGVAQVEIAPQDSFTASSGTLEFRFGSTQILFPDSRIDAMSLRMSTQGQIIGLRIFDRRWRWSLPVISGLYNHYFFEGTADAFQPVGLRLHAQDLARLLLGTLGESGYDVGSMPTDIYPVVSWDYTNAAKALADVAEQCGHHVVLRLNNTVMLAKVGIGANLPVGGEMEKSLSAELPDVPDSVTLVCGKSRYQTDFGLLPVGLDTDGSVKPIDDLSYKPAHGWGQEPYLDFPNLRGGATPVNGNTDPPNSPRALARRTVWKWYVIAAEAPIQIPHYGTVDSFNQILPLDNIQNQTIRRGGRDVPRDAKVYGIWADGGGGFQNFTQTQAYDRGFRIIQDRGIVEFNRPVFRWRALVGINRYEAIAAPIFLRTSFSVMRNAGYGWDRHEAVRAVPGARGDVGTKYILHDEMVAQFTRRYDNVGVLEGDFDNLADIAPEINYYLNAAVSEFEVKTPSEATYAGFLPIDPDGAIQQVTFSVSLAGAKTRASRNTEHSFTTPTYAQRRFYELQRAADFHDSQELARNLFQGAARAGFIEARGWG